MRHAKTEWGINVTVFVKRHEITIKELCDKADVAESTLYAVLTGKTPGREVVAKVDEYMERYEATRQAKHLATPFEGAKA